MRKLPSTLLVGYYGKKNLGDDALLLATTWATKNILESETLVCTASDSIDFPDFKQLKPTLVSKQRFPGQNRLLQYKLAWQSKQMVMGGGSVLHSAHDLNIKRLMFKLSNSNNSQTKLINQHMAVGVGIEHFSDEKSVIACQKFLNECPFVGVRDEQSYIRAKQLAPNANIAQTFDLAPALLCHPELIAHKKLTEQQSSIYKNRAGIAINLCSIPVDKLGNADQSAESERVLHYANLICKLLINTDQNITLLSLNAEPMGNTNRINDDGLLDKVKETVINLLESTDVSSRLTTIKYQPDPIETIKVLARFKLVIAMRLHASILSYVSNTPVFSINYHSKCGAWCRQIGMHQDYQIQANNPNIDAIYKTIIHGLDNGFKAPAMPIRTALSKSLKNWRLSDERINHFCDHSAL